MGRQKTREQKLFILRLWRDAPQDAWRLVIQSTKDAKPQGLTDLAALNVFLEAMMRDDAP